MATDVRHEASLHLQAAQGQSMGAALFLPAAVRLGLSGEFDVKAIALAVQWLAVHPGETIAVRVSLPSIEHTQFLPQLRSLLDAQAGLAATSTLPFLVLELDAHALVAAAQSVVDLSKLVQQHGIGLALRRLDQAPQALLEFSGIPLRYVKLGGHFAQRAMDNWGAKYLLEAMIQTAKEQGARVYVTDAVSPLTADWLRVKGASLAVPKA